MKKLTEKKKLTIKSITSRPRKEAFLPTDASFLARNPSITLGKKVGEGFKGEVFSLAGNRNFVVKLAGRNAHGRGERGIAREIEMYETHNLNNEPLFIPTKVVDLTAKYGGKGLLRPKLVPVIDNKHVKPHVYRRITDANLEELRRKIIHLSHKGYAFVDELQVGIDPSGRLLLYDADYFDKHPAGDQEPFRVNSYAWLNFLREIGKINKNFSYDDATAKYGTINDKERY